MEKPNAATMARLLAELARRENLHVVVSNVGEFLGNDADGNPVIQGEDTVTFRNHMIIVSPAIWDAIKDMTCGK